MHRKTIRIIIFISSTALAGILFTQIYWVSTALTLKEEQFDNSVRIAVKSVINQFQQKQTDTIFQQKIVALSCRKDKLDIWDYIDEKLLDSLMVDEIQCMEIGTTFEYGVYSKYNNRFVMGHYTEDSNGLLYSPYQFSLASIYKPGDYYLSVMFGSKTQLLLHRVELWVVLSILFVLILIVSFIFVIFTILHQKKISEIKTDFINNMTHEFKTPIATSTLAAEMIQREEVISNSERVSKYASIILDENNRLQSQVEQVLQVAILESGKRQFKIRRININRLIESAITSFELRIKDSNIRLEAKIDADSPFMMGDRVHLINIFCNLVDKAITYSASDPIIKIKTSNLDGSVVVSVGDNGIEI